MPQASDVRHTDGMTGGVTSGAMGRSEKDPPRRNGKLAIPLPFDEAMKAALEVKPPEKEPPKPRSKKSAKG